jgi:hypothetical protein
LYEVVDRLASLGIVFSLALLSVPAIAQVRIDGHVKTGNSPIAGTETCPPGVETGSPISPPGGYVGGLQIIFDVAIDRAGNVWVANNWNRPDEGFKDVPQEALSTRFGGDGTVVFFGLAAPVKTPLIGPVRAK